MFATDEWRAESLKRCRCGLSGYILLERRRDKSLVLLIFSKNAFLGKVDWS